MFRKDFKSRGLRLGIIMGSVLKISFWAYKQTYRKEDAHSDKKGKTFKGYCVKGLQSVTTGVSV